MKTTLPKQTPSEAGSALALTMIMTGVALAILASAMAWSANTTRLTHRSIQHTRAVVAAEAGTEKVLSRMTRDFLTGGEKLVLDNLAGYRQMVPTTADSSFWSGWEFNDADGNVDQTFVQRTKANSYVVLNSTYAGLRGFVSTYTVVAHARDTAALQNVVGGVRQEVQLARIPIFQFALYSSGDMEISCGQAFAVTGLVHANKQLYVEPDSRLTFESDVTAVNDILFSRHPLDTRGNPVGSVVYEGKKNRSGRGHDAPDRHHQHPASDPRNHSSAALRGGSNFTRWAVAVLQSDGHDPDRVRYGDQRHQRTIR